MNNVGIIAIALLSVVLSLGRNGRHHIRSPYFVQLVDMFLRALSLRAEEQMLGSSVPPFGPRNPTILTCA